MKLRSRKPYKAEARKKDLAEEAISRPGLWLLLRIWTSIGLQSFGGGATTLLLIRREFVEKHPWLTNEEFARSWNLCIMTPGINLIALTILLGRKLGGAWGIAASLIGLLLPSATITCLLTAGFKVVQNQPVIQAILRGVVPATAGIMLVVGVKFAQPLLKLGREEGNVRFALSLIIILGAATALILFKVTVVLVLICAALVGIGSFSGSSSSTSVIAAESHGEEE